MIRNILLISALLPFTFSICAANDALAKLQKEIAALDALVSARIESTNTVKLTVDNSIAGITQIDNQIKANTITLDKVNGRTLGANGVGLMPALACFPNDKVAEAKLAAGLNP